MSHTTDEILEKLKALTLIESVELVAQIEETFDVDASVSIGRIIISSKIRNHSNAPTIESTKTNFDVVLESVSRDNRVATLKVIRSLTNVGLKEAKDFCSDLPKVVKEGISKEEAEIAKKELEVVGSSVTIKLNCLGIYY
jgi:large subunit ribosomal protein L7/L12